MHELSLAENMRELIDNQAQKEGFKQVTKVVIEVGKLSHVEADAMRFCFDSVMQGGPAEQAELEIIESPGLGRCLQCDTRSDIEHLYEPCKQCGAFGLEILQGDRVAIKTLEVLE